MERLLEGVGDALLLTLPGLTEVVVETPGGSRVLTRSVDPDDPASILVADSERGTARWRTVTRSGVLTAELLKDRPVEERLRPHWSVTWAVPVDGEGAPLRPGTAPVVHAPTPTDEPLTLPALLIASFPLDSTRRHPAPGPLTDFVVARAADAYAELLAQWQPVSTGTVDLVPGPLGKGVLDGAIRGAVLELLPRVAFLPPAVPSEDLTALRPFEAEVVEGAGADTVRVLGEVLPTLLPAGLERRSELRALGVARLPLGDAVDRLAGAERDPAWWHRLYESLAGVDPDRLTGLPVPLADGRTTIGPRQVLLPGPDTPADLARLGLKVAHPQAAHPVLEKLGALPATPRAVLTTPQVRAAVAASMDDDTWDEDALDPEELAEVVLGLVREAGLAPGDEPWLGALALPDEDGELAPACELVLPGGPFASVMREGELALCDAEWADRWGEQPLAACGVLAGFALVRASDVVLDPDELEPRDTDYAEPDDVGLLDAVDVWCEDVLDRLPEAPVPPVATELVAVRDLELVDDDRWPQALALLAQPPLRDALTQRVRVLLPDGTTESVHSYTAWWLRDHPVLGGRRPAGLRAAGADPLLEGLYESADTAGFDDVQVLHALGVRTSVAALLDGAGRRSGAAGAARRPGPAGHGRAAARPVHGAGRSRPRAGDPAGRAARGRRRRGAGGGRRRRGRRRHAGPAALTAGLPLLPVAPSRAADLAELLQRAAAQRVRGGTGGDGGRGARGAGVGARAARRGDAGDVRRARRAGRRRGCRARLAPHPGRRGPRRHAGGRRGGPGLGGGAVAAPLRGGGAAGGRVPHGRTGPRPLVRLSAAGPLRPPPARPRPAPLAHRRRRGRAQAGRRRSDTGGGRGPPTGAGRPRGRAQAPSHCPAPPRRAHELGRSPAPTRRARTPYQCPAPTRPGAGPEPQPGTHAAGAGAGPQPGTPRRARTAYRCPAPRRPGAGP